MLPTPLFSDDIEVNHIMNEHACELYDEWLDIHAPLLNLVIRMKELQDEGQSVPEHLHHSIETEYHCLNSVYDDMVKAPMRDTANERGLDWEMSAPSARPDPPIDSRSAPPKPKGLREAMSGPFKKYFLAAMKAKMEALLHQQCMRPYPLPLCRQGNG